jgi:NAD(P)-dependent dehydrogenase (short-subunit alcohol dehydrogenase family)
MDLHLTDRVVLVTGGSSGVGLATVRTLHGEGALLATCARDGERLAKALADAGIPADRFLAQACDVRDRTSVENLIAAVGQRYGRLDGVVNNAGQSRMKRLADTTAEDWQDELDLKFSSVLNPTMTALPLLQKSAAASIVNINAILAVQPEPRLVTTSAARAGVLNLSRTMADDFAADGIRVNSVCLGLIDTGQWRRRYEDAVTTKDYPAWQGDLAADRGVALGRLGSPEEVAAVVAFLLSDRSSYVTGSAIDVGGGVGRGIH